MELHTAQIAQWRTANERKLYFIDTTVKSGDSVFAPTWDIVMDHKSGRITDEEYTEVYRRIMRASYLRDPERWLEVCQMEHVCIACYCPRGKFCHRHILAGYLEKVCYKLNIPFTMRGELIKY